MHSFQPHVVTGSPAQTGLPAGPRWAPLVLALLLAACAHSPRAAVPELPAAEVPTAAITTCTETPSARAALQRAGQELQAHGMVLQATCPAAGGGWVVKVRVVDGMKASKVVRGPLADGHDVDMGTPAGVELAGAAAAAQGFSPDVRHNRDWLRAMMARHQFENTPDAWWRFAQRGTAPVRTADADLAAR